MLTPDRDVDARGLGASPERGDANMMIRAVIFGAMLALTPSLALLALVFWGRRVGLPDGGDRDLGRLHASHDLNLDDQPLYPNS
jgi:hypothetical protein